MCACRSLSQSYLALTKIVDFFLHLLPKFWVRPFPAILNITWRKWISEWATILFTICIYQPWKALSFLFVLGNSHYVAFSEHRFPLLFVSAVSQASLAIFPGLYFKVFPFLFLLILSIFFHTSIKKKKKGHNPSIFGFRNIQLSLCFQALSHLMPSILVIYFSTL